MEQSERGERVAGMKAERFRSGCVEPCRPLERCWVLLWDGEPLCVLRQGWTRSDYALTGKPCVEDRLKEARVGGLGDQLKAIVMIQQRHHYDVSNQSSGSRDGAKLPDSRYVLKGETVEFTRGMDVSMKEKESRMTSRFLA